MSFNWVFGNLKWVVFLLMVIWWWYVSVNLNFVFNVELLIVVIIGIFGFFNVWKVVFSCFVSWKMVFGLFVLERYFRLLLV